MISSTLLHLLALTSISHDGTLPSIVAATQAMWIRKAGQERWDMRDTLDYEKNREPLLAALTDLGMVHAVAPMLRHYNHVIVYGGTIKRVRKRLAYLLALWRQGVRFDTVVFLCGQRPLDAHEEPYALLSDAADSGLIIKSGWQLPAQLPEHETAMMRLIFEQTELPAGFEEVPSVWIDVPMMYKADGSLARPTTADTIKAWLAMYPAPGSILAITTQPRVLDQDAVMRAMLSPLFTLETVAPAADKNEKIAIYLDSLARYLYCMQLNNSKLL